jgi:hypothetical protein
LGRGERDIASDSYVLIVDELGSRADVFERRIGTG